MVSLRELSRCVLQISWIRGSNRPPTIPKFPWPCEDDRSATGDSPARKSNGCASLRRNISFGSFCSEMRARRKNSGSGGDRRILQAGRSSILLHRQGIRRQHQLWPIVLAHAEQLLKSMNQFSPRSVSLYDAPQRTARAKGAKSKVGACQETFWSDGARRGAGSLSSARGVPHWPTRLVATM